MEYVSAKTIVTKTKSPSSWFGYDYNMNIYRGCCHGCIYCDSRSDCYRVTDFDQVKAKENALEIIRNDLRRKVLKGVVGTGAMSDPYNIFEKDQLLTRHALELVNAYDFGIGIATKSDLIVRDIDILQEIKEHAPVLCKITITTCDDALAGKIEPHAPSSGKRFAAVKGLADKGIYTGILFMPVLPFITDTVDNVKELVKQGKDNGARFIYPAFGVTLRDGQRHYYYEQLDKLFPGLKEVYIKRYGNRYSCSSPHAKRLYEVFVNECEKYGVLYKMSDIIPSYKRGYDYSQLSLFDM